MMLHFSYGSNMSRALMRARCPGATALGVATLAGWRFVINPDGVGSLAPRRGGVVHGVVWRLTLRDLAAVNAYESVDTRLYLRRRVAVWLGRRRSAALVFIARRRGPGRPRPGYVSIVVDAARDWRLPAAYVDSLQRWSPSGWRGTRAKDIGELA
jgi:cation transport regulator ChaC